MKDIRVFLPVPVLLLILIILLLAGCRGIVPLPGDTDEEPQTLSSLIKMPFASCTIEEQIIEDEGTGHYTDDWSVIPEALVELKEIDNCKKLLATTFADESGYYEFNDIGPGIYIITAYCPESGQNKYLLKDAIVKKDGQFMYAGTPDFHSTSLALILEYMNDCFEDAQSFKENSEIYRLVSKIAEDVRHMDILEIIESAERGELHDDFGNFGDSDSGNGLVGLVYDQLLGCCLSPEYGPPTGPGQSPTPTYRVYYENGEADDGEPPQDTNKYKKNATITVKGSGTLEKTGHSFNGWLYQEGTSKSIQSISRNSQGNNDEIIYFGGDTFKMPGDDVTMFPRWDANDYEIELSVNPEDTGEVSGEGTYNMGDPVTIEADPAEGYRFVSWTDDYDEGAEVSTDDSYVFEMPAENLTYTANFEIDEDKWSTITFRAGENGSLDPNDVDEFKVLKDTLWSEIVVPDIIPDDGYIFDRWDPELPAGTTKINLDTIYTAKFKCNPCGPDERSLVASGFRICSEDAVEILVSGEISHICWSGQVDGVIKFYDDEKDEVGSWEDPLIDFSNSNFSVSSESSIYDNSFLDNAEYFRIYIQIPGCGDEPFLIYPEGSNANGFLQLVNLYTVTYYDCNDNELSTEKVADGSLVPEPDDPCGDGYTVDGWYASSDRQSEFEWDFDNPIGNDLDLYAKCIIDICDPINWSANVSVCKYLVDPFNSPSFSTYYDAYIRVSGDIDPPNNVDGGINVDLKVHLWAGTNYLEIVEIPLTISDENTFSEDILFLQMTMTEYIYLNKYAIFDNYELKIRPSGCDNWIMMGSGYLWQCQ